MDDLTEQFSSKNFSPDKFVKEISRRCVGGIELHQQRGQIQNLADETNSILKKNVYHNYTLFIETAKEISRLEGDMYQLSHLLSEQRSLLSTLASASIFQNQERLPVTDSESNKDEDENTELRRKQALSDIAEKIEGCINLTENSGRYFSYEGDLIELDAIDNNQIRKLHAYLLSDVLLLTSTITNRRTPARYKLETVYDVNNLAIVNVKDIKYSFKLLAFPDTRVFQASNSQAKKDWLEKFEEAKKLHINSQNRKRGSISVEPKSPALHHSNDFSTNSFEDPEDDVDDVEELPDWLLEVAEDLDVLIVERHFEDAYLLIEKTRNYLKESPPSNEIVAQDILGKVDVRVKTLTEILTKELEVTPERSYQSDLRPARRAVRLLNTLQKSTQACDMFLKLCSNILKTRLKQVKKESATAVYVRQLSAVFFSNLRDMAKEFQYQAFPNNPYCASSFVVWCTKEVSYFMSQLIRQVVVPQVSITVLNKCVEHLRFYSEQLTEFGLDVTYQIDGQLRTPLNRVLSETKEKLMKSIDEKAAEETWQLTYLKTKSQAEKLISEFNELGIVGVEKYITGDFRLELSNNTLWFARTCAHLMQNSSFIVPNILQDIEQIIYDIVTGYIEHVVNALRSGKFKGEVRESIPLILCRTCRSNKSLLLSLIKVATFCTKQAIEINIQFIAEDFIPSCEALYEKYFGIPSVRLTRMRNELKT